MIELLTWAKETLRLGNIGLLVAILAFGVLLSFVRPRWGRRWAVVVALGYWFVSTPFGSTLLVAPLSRGFHAIEDPREAQSVEAIVVLGAGLYDLKARSDALTYPSEPTALRVLEGARVHRMLQGRPLVVASGGYTRAGQQTSEGAVIADALTRLHVPRDRIVVEDASRTTHEQAILVTRLLRSRGVGRFVLVTSPTHMSRSVAVFRAQSADVLPSTAPLLSDNVPRRRFFVANRDSFGLSDESIHEYGGYLYYWARGWFRAAPSGSDR